MKYLVNKSLDFTLLVVPNIAIVGISAIFNRKYIDSFMAHVPASDLLVDPGVYLQKKVI